MVLVSGLVTACAGNIEKETEDGSSGQVEGHEVAKCISIRAAVFSLGLQDSLWVELEPTKWAVPAAIYGVELYKKGEYRESKEVSWNSPELDVKEVRSVYFSLTSEEYDAYLKLGLDLRNIFSVKIIGAADWQREKAEEEARLAKIREIEIEEAKKSLGVSDIDQSVGSSGMRCVFGYLVNSGSVRVDVDTLSLYFLGVSGEVVGTDEMHVGSLAGASKYYFELRGSSWASREMVKYILQVTLKNGYVLKLGEWTW